MASSATQAQQLLQPLVGIARRLGFDLPDGFGSPACLSHAMWSDHSPLAVRLTVQEDARKLGVMPWVRTSSWNYDGERTDLHDVTALSYALDLHSAFGLSAGFIPEGGVLYFGNVQRHPSADPAGLVWRTLDPCRSANGWLLTDGGHAMLGAGPGL